ncbi:MAG TPA: glycosyltransferase family 9 protein [Blastocatellia bacterium]|nr:glycosyltransferase family 9 protein [Blastocatellia bacterium]
MIQAAPETRMPDWSRVRKVLLVRLRSIGDTILMTPCLAALKSWRPDIEITVLSEPLAAPVLDGHPLVDNLVISEKSLSSRARLVGRLRRERFDVAFNMHGGSTAAIIARLSGAPCTVGYKDYRSAWMLTARAPAPDLILGRTRLHSVEQQLALIHWSGMPWPRLRPQLSLAESKEAEASVREKLKQAVGLSDNFAIIAPAAAFESKRWTAEGFASVADHLSERWNLPSVIIAGPGQEHLAEEVSARARSRACVLAGLSLKELIALIGLARVFVGNDGGPMHIAAAAGRPIASVFGSSNANVWHPWTGSPYKIIKSVEQTERRKDTNVASTSEESEFAIRLIPVAEVIAAVDEVLEMAPAAG